MGDALGVRERKSRAIAIGSRSAIASWKVRGRRFDFVSGVEDLVERGARRATPSIEGTGKVFLPLALRNVPTLRRRLRDRRAARPAESEAISSLPSWKEREEELFSLRLARALGDDEALERDVLLPDRVDGAVDDAEAAFGHGLDDAVLSGEHLPDQIQRVAAALEHIVV